MSRALALEGPLGPLSYNGEAFAQTNGVLTTQAGTGITAGSGTVYYSFIQKNGPVIHTSIYVDLTGLNSGGTAADIIGVAAAANCHIGQYTTADCGTIFAGKMTCLELPAGGDPNIDLYSADEATGVEDTAVTSLTNDAALIASSGVWIATGALTVQSCSAVPAANQYIYLVAGAATDATYTAGKFLIEFFGV